MNKWDIRFLQLAEHISTWSTCLKRRVGAVLVKNKHIMATGYNGAIKGVSECIETGICKRKSSKSGQNLELCIGVHAEQNALIQCRSAEGCTLYCTHLPCTTCMKLLINAGVKRIVYIEEYSSDLTKQLAQKKGIELTQITTEQHYCKYCGCPLFGGESICPDCYNKI